MNRNLLLGGLAVVLVSALTAGWVFVGVPLQSSAVVGTGYVAKYVCSCHFVSQRDANACKADLGPDMDAINMQVDKAAQSVTASVPVLAAATARHQSGFGCSFVE